MTHSLIKTSFMAGELAPSLWGATDFAKFAAGCSTMRNCFVNYRMGCSSRAGLAFVGQCLPSGDGPRPRPITFRFNVNINYILEFGDFTMRVVFQGGYVEETAFAFAVTAATQSNPAQLTAPGNDFADGDWVAASGIGGMTELNGQTYIVSNPGAGAFTLKDTFGDPIDSLAFSAFTAGGTVARIFTAVSPYAIEDLDYLKFTQSADVMTLDCTNTVTGTEYPVYDLSRNAPDDWTFTLVNFDSRIAAPTGAAAVASNVAGSHPTQYQYVITAIDAVTGEESIASNVASADNSVNIAVTAGAITVTWTAVAGASRYNIYKAPPAVYDTTVPIGSAFYFAGFSYGTQWVDSNVVADVTRTPPQKNNPFARGRITDARPLVQGSGYVQSTTTVDINTTTGAGAVITPVVVGGAVVAYIVNPKGHDYAATDTMTVVGAGTLATGTLTIGAQSGTYPGVDAYFQERMVHAATLNSPDTYYGSKPALRSNFDAGDPPVDDDALSGTPWGQQVNGIQWMLPVTGGLLCMTGLSIWKVSGSGQVALTPSSQDAEPQEYNGISPTVGPIRIKQDVLYVQEKGGLVNDLEFNFYNNTFTGSDISVISNHLFANAQITQWDWAQEPNKLAWAVRDDGRVLSLTYVKDQKVAGWARHDTNGLFVGVAVASETPVDAPYFIVRRYIPGKQRFAYYMERMDDRIWPNAETVWAVDAGLKLALPTPNATLASPSAAAGANVPFTASAAVFDGITTGVAGQVIRMGGGKATVTSYVTPTLVLATITMPITATIPNDPSNRPVPAAAGEWSIATPVSTISGLNHLEGYLVTGLADGAVIAPREVVDGSIELDRSATAVVVGLPFLPQMQTMYADVPGQETIQGDRQRVWSVKFRCEASRGVTVGTNQPNASAQENQAEIPWGQGTQFVGKMRPWQPVQNLLIAAGYLPLVTGDVNVNVDGDWDLTGMVAFEQPFPLPMNILMSVSETAFGDTSG